MKNSDITRGVATPVDWCVVLYPNIYKSVDNPEVVFAQLNCDQEIALFGRAKNHPRENGKTGFFADGHRLVTSPIMEVKDGKYYTVNTVYTLDEKDKNANFKKWCEEILILETKL